MSFSSTIKNELARIAVVQLDEVLAELAGLVRMCGRIHWAGSGRLSLSLTTENAGVARRIFTFVKRSYTEEVTVSMAKNFKRKRMTSYHIEIPDRESALALLNDVEFIHNENVFMPVYPVSEMFIKDDGMRRAYIRGSFLGAGSVSNPERSYHLEFVCEREDHAKDLAQMIASYGLRPKQSLRKEQHIVYFKDAEQISDMLSLLGAHQGVLKFEDIRVVKDMRNRINRQVNCETANLTKTVDAAMRQIRAIEALKKAGRLPLELEEVANLRIRYPDASLKEIGQLLDPPLGKSGINHRLKKIEELAKKL